MGADYFLTSHSTFYNKVGQIAILSHVQASDGSFSTGTASRPIPPNS